MLASGLETQCPLANLISFASSKEKGGENFTLAEKCEKFTPLCLALRINS